MKAPNSKLQAPEKRQASSSKKQPYPGDGPLVRQRLGGWSLKFLWGLVLGAWCLDHTLAFGAADDALAATNRIDAQQRRGRFGGPERGVYKSQINPHWFQNDTRFWYRNDLAAGAKEFIVVDAEHGSRQRAFDHEKLAASLSKAAGKDFQADHLPFSEI